MEKRKSKSNFRFVNQDTSNLHAILKASGSIDGVGIKYRVDKNNPVQLGYEYEFQTDDDYIVKGDDFNSIIESFKKGNNLIYKITSSNQFIKDGKDEGFIIWFYKSL